MEIALSQLWRADHSVVKREKQELSSILKRRWSDVAVEYGAVIRKVLNN